MRRWRAIRSAVRAGVEHYRLRVGTPPRVPDLELVAGQTVVVTIGPGGGGATHLPASSGGGGGGGAACA